MTVKIGVCGAAGKMGKAILEVCKETSGIEISAAIEHPDSSKIGIDAGEVAGIGKLGIVITDDILSVAKDVDVMIDFTLATSVIQNIDNCVAGNCKMVIGTTGLDEKDHSQIKTAANKIALVCAPNLTILVNLCFKLLEITSHVLGHDAYIQIV